MNTPQTTGPVTISIARQIKPHMEAQAEAWLKEVAIAAAAFEGFMGIETIANPAKHELVTIFRFANYDLMTRWRDSEVRREWLKRGEAFTVTSSDLQIVTGLEYWFKLPDSAAMHPPPRYKMMLVTWLALSPLSLLVTPIVSDGLAWLPLVPRVLTVTAIMIVMMTYGAMPFMTRLLAWWLYPQR